MTTGSFGTPDKIETQAGVRYGAVEVRCGGSPTILGSALVALNGGHDYLLAGWYDLREDPKTTAEWLR